MPVLPYSKFQQNLIDSGYITSNELGNFMEVNCSAICQLPSIFYNYGGQIIELKGEDYVVIEEGICYIYVFGEDYKPGGVLAWNNGVPFLSTYYAEFNMEKKEIKFAKSINPRYCNSAETCRKKNNYFQNWYQQHPQKLQ